MYEYQYVVTYNIINNKRYYTIKMNWDQELCIKLIKEFKVKEILWNPRNGNYHNKLKKEEAWNNLAELLEKDVEEVKKKIESLKGSYRREKSRVRKCIVTGKGRDSIYESKWFAYESLKFLDDKDEPRESLNKLESEYISTENDDDVTIISDEKYEGNEREEQNLHTEVPPNETNKRTFKSPLQRASKRQSCSENQKIQEGFGYLKEVTSGSKKQKDQCSLFGDFVADKLRSFDNRLRAIAQHKIHNVIFELEMATYDPLGTHHS